MSRWPDGSLSEQPPLQQKGKGRCSIYVYTPDVAYRTARGALGHSLQRTAAADSAGRVAAGESQRLAQQRQAHRALQVLQADHCRGRGGRWWSLHHCWGLVRLHCRPYTSCAACSTESPSGILQLWNYLPFPQVAAVEHRPRPHQCCGYNPNTPRKTLDPRGDEEKLSHWSNTT